MAGEMPRKSTSGRKQWILQGDQRGSLNRLRNQLASDGCPESQVVLAKQLLNEESEFESEQRENARSAVFWLIKASQQGNIEATNLLRTCFKTGKGINEHNYMDVKTCINMTQDEKVVLKAAKEIFASLSNGSDYITSNQLQKKILAIDRGQGCSKSTLTNNLECSDDMSRDFDQLIGSEDDDDDESDIDWSEKSLLYNEKLTEDKLVSAAITFSNGSLPIVNNSLCLIEPDLRALDNIPFLYWSILHPILSLQILYFKLIKYLASKTIPLPLVPTNTFQLSLLVFTYYEFGSKNLTHFISSFMFYTSFLIMIISTFQMLQIQREIQQFRLWRGLFICYSNRDLNEYSFETQFILNHIKPYVWYFIALLIHYFSYSLTPMKMESEFTMISCLLMFITLYGFMRMYRSKTIIDYFVLLSFAVNFLARYPYDTDQIVSKGWRYLELNVPTFPNYVIGNGIEFCISFRLLLLYIFIPLLLLRMASDEKWRGSYKILLPHLVTLSWLQYFTLCSQYATMYGLCRATLALVGSVLFLPLVGLTSVILPVVAVTKWLIEWTNFIYAFSLFIFLLLICLSVCYLCARTRFARYTAILQVLLMLIAFLSLIVSIEFDSIKNFQLDSNDGDDVNVTPLDWNSFQEMCYKRAWQDSSENRIGAQLRCAELDQIDVFWEGIVHSAHVQSISNFYRDIFDRLPSFASSYLTCRYGVQFQIEYETGIVVKQQKCSLKNYNIYTYDVALKMGQSAYWNIVPIVHLHLEHEFGNFTINLKEHDHVWFKGKLRNGENIDGGSGGGGILGSLSVNVHVDEIGCISCANNELNSFKLSKNNNFFTSDIFSQISYGFKFVLNVMFNPLLMFT